MSPNVYGVERVLRLVLGALMIITAALTGSTGARLGLGMVGIIILGTGIFRYCPIYGVCGVSRSPGSSAALDSEATRRKIT